MNLTFIIFLSWIAIVLMAPFWFRKKPKEAIDYTLANKKVGFFGLTSTLVMTEVNPTTLLAFSSLAIPFGIAALWFPVVFLAGLVFYTLAVSKKWASLKKATSAVDFFVARYGKSNKTPLTIIFALVLLAFCATYLKATAYIFEIVFNWSLATTIGITCLVVLLFTLLGGYRAVVQTDTLSFILLIFLFPIGYFSLPATEVLPAAEVVATLSGPPPLYAISLILLCIFSYILSPWYAHRMFSAKSKSIAFGAMALTSLLVFGIYSLGILTVLKGLSLVKSLTIPDQALPYLFLKTLDSPFLRGLFLSFFFSVSLSTISSLWNTTAILISNGLKKSDEEPNVKTIKIITLLVALWTAFSSYYFVEAILPKLILTNIPLVALSFGLLAGMYWRRANAWGLWTSFVVGNLWGWGCYFYYGEAGLYTWHWAVKGIPLIFLTGIFVSLLMHPKKAT